MNSPRRRVARSTVLALSLAFSGAGTAQGVSAPVPGANPIPHCESYRDAGYVEAICLCVDTTKRSTASGRLYALFSDPPPAVLGEPMAAGQCLKVQTATTLTETACATTCKAAVPNTSAIKTTPIAPGQCWQLVAQSPAIKAHTSAYSKVVGAQLLTDPSNCRLPPGAAVTTPQPPASLNVDSSES